MDIYMVAAFSAMRDMGRIGTGHGTGITHLFHHDR